MAGPEVKAGKRNRVKTGQRQRLSAGPVRITIREVSFAAPEGGNPIKQKWIYLFEKDTDKLYAEIFAEKPDLWHIEYRPNSSKEIKDFDNKRNGDVVVNRKRLDDANYRVFLSPIRASGEALDLLKKDLSALEVVVVQGKTTDALPYVYAGDYYKMAEMTHLRQYLPALLTWEKFVQNKDRQARLFIASVVKNWMADGDPADVAQYLKDKKAPERVIAEYEKKEKKTRMAAERAMVGLLDILDKAQHKAIDVSARGGGQKELAVGLLHWGIVSQSMLNVAPGRVYSQKMMEKDEALPCKVLFSEAQNRDLYGAYATFKKVYASSINTVIELMAAKVRHLRKSAGPARRNMEKVKLYLRNLGLETELKGTHKKIHERLEAGDKITKKLKGSKRSRVITSYQKLVKKSGTAIPDYNEKATELLETADRVNKKQLAAADIAASFQFLFDLISFISSIEEYRAAFPDSKNEKLIGIVGAGGDFYSAAAEVAEGFSKRSAFLRISGGAAGFISGVVDMLDAEEKGVKAAMNNNDYAAAVGHGITAVGASMTALAGGVLLVKGITGGALFGGPFGAVVGAIGAGLMAAGMLVVGFFSDNDYQTFVRHCFLGEDHGESVTPEWSTVSFGSGSLSSEVAALYDLLYRYKVSFVKTAKVTPGLPHDTTKWSGLKLTIDQGYGTGKDEKYHIDLKLRHHSRYVTGTFTVKNLVLPDKKSATGTGGKAHTPYIVRRWSPGEVVDEMIREGNAKATSTQVLDNLYLYSGDFSVSVQLSVNGRLTGKPTRIKGETGGKETLGLIDMGWKHVDFE